MSQATAQTKKQSPDTILFDLGGVLIDWNPRYLYRKIFDDEAEMEKFLSEICHPHWNFLHDTGALAFETSIPDLQYKYPDYQAEIAAWRDRWPEMLGGEITDTVNMLTALKEKDDYNLFALTNWAKETWHYAIERFDFLNFFRGILVSGQEKLAKPDPEIFYLTAKRFGLDPAKTLFIDDNGPNIQQARELGFKTHHFTSPQNLHSFLKDQDLL